MNAAHGTSGLENRAVQTHADDNVATALAGLEAGDIDLVGFSCPVP
jgi:hypothetical protein